MLQQHLILLLIGLSELLAQNYISSTLIGDGRSLSRDGYTNYGSAAVSSVAGLNKVNTVLADSNRSKIYLTDEWGNKIRVFDMKTNYLSTLSGDGLSGFLNGNGSIARWSKPAGMVMDSVGNLLVSDWENCCIRKVTLDGLTSTFSGKCTVCGFADGASSTAQFNRPGLMTIDQNDTLYVADYINGRIRKILPDGSVTTLAGGSTMDNIDGPALNARFNNPYDIKIDASGNLFVADSGNHLIRKISSLGFVSLYAGSSNGYADGTWNQARFRIPNGLAIDNNGNIFVSDQGNRVIRKIDANRTVTTISGTVMSGVPITGYADGAISESLFAQSRGLHIDINGRLYVADWDSSTVRVLYPENQCVSGSALCVGQDFKCRTGLCVERLAGTGFSDWRDGDRLTAAFNRPFGLALDRVTGNLYIAELYGHRIRKLSPDGLISTHAGDGILGFVNGPASSSRFNWPHGLVVDSSGTLYVSDYGNHCIRKVSVDLNVSTLAGVCGSSGFRDGDGNVALFTNPGGLTLDNNGSLFLAGHGEGRIRKIDLTSLSVSTFAGKGLFGYADGQGIAATFNVPHDVAFNNSGYLFVADTNNHMIRVISPSGYVSTFAGSSSGLLDGQGTAAMFNYPTGLAFDDIGNLYIADNNNQAVRKVLPSGLVTSIFNSKNLQGDQIGPALKASFRTPRYIEVDANGTIYVSDEWAHRINIICNMTCLNGVADCFSSKCKCDIGWAGTNCDELIPTTTTTTSSTSTSTTTMADITNTEHNFGLSETTENPSIIISSSSATISISSHKFVQTSFETESSVSVVESFSQSTSLSLSIFVVSVAAGLLVIGSAIFITSYIIRRRSRRRLRVNGSQKFINSNQNLNSAFRISSNYNQNMTAYASANAYNNGGLLSNEYNSTPYGYHSNIPPSNLYVSSNNSAIELTHRVTQNVSTSPLCLPGYSILNIGFDYVLPEIIDNLGNGGTASIYGGTLINPKLVQNHGITSLAVKIFPHEVIGKGSAFLYEVAIMNLIPPNPHVCKFIGYMETPRLAIIMQQYEGSLYSLIKDKSITIDPILCLKIARDVVTGMNLIHGMNILHLDIKPHNILWERLQDGSMNFCICDFGFASLVGDSRSIVSGLQVPKSVGVTVRYTAPEVLFRLAMLSNSGRVNSELDKKIDVFAFGMSMYSVMLGGQFWTDLEYAEIMHTIQKGERPSIEQLPFEMQTHEYSKILINIVKECWKQNPTDRPTFADIFSTLI